MLQLVNIAFSWYRNPKIFFCVFYYTLVKIAFSKVVIWGCSRDSDRGLSETAVNQQQSLYQQLYSFWNKQHITNNILKYSSVSTHRFKQLLVSFVSFRRNFWPEVVQSLIQQHIHNQYYVYWLKLITYWIPFGDHPWKLEGYREY